MYPARDYYGPVWIVSGEHKGKLGFVDDYDELGGESVAIVYLEGETPSVGAYVLVPVHDLEQPPESEIKGLEERIWVSAVMKHGPSR